MQGVDCQMDLEREALLHARLVEVAATNYSASIS